MKTVTNAYNNNKVELSAGVKVVKKFDLAAKILKSDAFTVVNLEVYLRTLEKASGCSFNRLIKFVSLSPFFNEGDAHQEIRKNISVAFTNENLALWNRHFTSEIDALTSEVKSSPQLDLVEYNFTLARKLLRPLILGFTSGLPADFEKRLYEFQKIVEPLLSLRQLKKLEGELEYLFTHARDAIQSVSSYEKFSLPYLMGDTFTKALSEEDGVMLLLIVYGAKAPLMQTLNNMILEVIRDNRVNDFAFNSFSDTKASHYVNDLFFRSAALLHLHRVATSAFEHDELSVREGDYVIIRTRLDSKKNKGLGFGMRTHYCIGAVLARNIISMVLPRLFTAFPDLKISSLKYDENIHTAQAISSLIVHLR